MDYFSLLKPFLYAMPEETAHEAALWALSKNLFSEQPPVMHKSLHSKLWDINFDNPIGLAAGFDKNGEVIKQLLSLGFGFVEVGTATPRPQPGNPKPRLFRLTEDNAIINRLGFNNNGAEEFVQKLEAWSTYQKANKARGIVGANIGKNKNSNKELADYITMIGHVHGICDYITINISSPNTPGLRKLQNRENLEQLLAEVMKTRRELSRIKKHISPAPILVKIAPDLSEEEQKDIAEVVMNNEIDGIIIGNTTLERPKGLKNPQAGQEGGLSGKPLFQPSTRILKNMFNYTEGKIPLIGVGGVFSAEDAYKKIRAGASLVQIYSALIFKGFGLVNEINAGLIQLLEKDGFANISRAIGVDAKK